tara:strand:- start:189 stop:362 length:174 start_codon:yes stop_codon:yes gene_type:complete
MNITVRVKDNFGNRAVYPVCSDAQTFAELAGTKTLTDETIRLVKDLGYEVQIQPQTL